MPGRSRCRASSVGLGPSVEADVPAGRRIPAKRSAKPPVSVRSGARGAGAGLRRVWVSHGSVVVHYLDDGGIVAENVPLEGESSPSRISGLTVGACCVGAVGPVSGGRGRRYPVPGHWRPCPIRMRWPERSRSTRRPANGCGRGVASRSSVSSMASSCLPRAWSPKHQWRPVTGETPADIPNVQWGAAGRKP
jgi:hypothetical protein